MKSRCSRPSKIVRGSRGWRGLAMWLASAVCLLLPSSTRAQSVGEQLTLLDAVEQALSFYPSVASSVAARDAARAAVDEAEAQRFPLVALGATATRYQEPMVVHPIHAFTPNETPPFDRTLFQVRGQMSYTLFDGGARNARIEASRAEEGAAEVLVGGAGQSLLSFVIGAYLEALGQSQAIEAHDRSLAALEAERSRVRQLFDVGRAARIEILRVEASIASAEAERVAVASSLERAERNLARLTGAPVEETRAGRLVPVSIAESRPPPREELRQRALDRRPSVRAARQRHDAAEALLLGARSERFPDVSLAGSYIDHASANGINELEWNVGLQLTYSLFNGGAVSSGIARARAQERRAAQETRLAESEVEQDLDRALSGLDEARARARSLTTAVRRFEEVVRIERLRLDTGSSTQTDYLRSEADLLTARADLIRASYGVVFAWTELARATGQLTRDWVADNVRSEP